MANGVYDEITVVVAEDVAMTSDMVTEKLDIHAYDCGGMVISWSGANATINPALLIPQFSIDGVNWCNYIPESSAQRADKPSGSKMYEFTTLCFKYVRFRFLKKSNSAGTMTVKVYSKRWYKNRG